MAHPFDELDRELNPAFGPVSGRPPRRKPGAQPGNQNARKRGLYDKALTREQRNLLRAVRRDGSLTREIALLRVKVAALLTDPDADPDLVLRAARMLVSMLNLDRRRLARDG